MKLCVSRRCFLSTLLAITALPIFSQAGQAALQRRLFDAVTGRDGTPPLEVVLRDPDVVAVINDRMHVSTGSGEQWFVVPLHLAAYNDLRDIARVLLDHGANINIPDVAAQTPLHLAAGRGKVEFARLLLDRGARVNAQDGLSETPLHEAVGSNSVGVVMLLLGHGADLNVRDMRGWTPLHKLVVEQIIPLKSQLETMSFLALAENGQEADEYRAKQRALERAKVIARALIGRGATVSGDIIRLLNQAGQRGLAEQLIREELERVQQQYSV